MPASEEIFASPRSAPTEKGFSRGYRTWLLFVLLLVNALNIADRQGMAITAPAIKRDLHLTDTQLGVLLGLGFAIFFSLLALPIARLAEHRSRVRIVAISAAVLGAMMALCGLVQNFSQFLLCRIGVGAGDAGFGPPVASLIGDHYPAEKRATVTAIIWLGAPLGAVGGSVIGGWLAQAYGWRMWFFMIAVPALLLPFAAFITLRDPPRGMSDGRALNASPPSMSAVIRFLWAKPSIRQVLIGAGLAAISLNALGQFFARYFVANFHVGLAEAGRILGLMAGTAMASGLLLGGFGVDRLAKSDRRWYVRAPGLALLAAAPLFMAGALQPTLVGAVAVLLLGHIALFVFWTPTLALAQNMVGADMRASSAFVVNIVLGLVGIGLGPTLIGILSDAFANISFAFGNFAQMCPAGLPPPNANAALTAACRAASGEGVRDAIVAMSLLFAWAGVHYLLASRDLERDLDTHYAG